MPANAELVENAAPREGGSGGHGGRRRRLVEVG